MQGFEVECIAAVHREIKQPADSSGIILGRHTPFPPHTGMNMHWHPVIESAASTWARELTNFTWVSFHHRCETLPLSVLFVISVHLVAKARKRASKHRDPPPIPPPIPPQDFFFFLPQGHKTRGRNELSSALCATHRDSCLFKPTKCSNHLTKLQLSYAELWWLRP